MPDYKRMYLTMAGAAELYLRLFSHVRVLRLAHPPAERTFYLITPKGRDLTASAHQLLDDLHRHLTLVDGITLF